MKYLIFIQFFLFIYGPVLYKISPYADLIVVNSAFLVFYNYFLVARRVSSKLFLFVALFIVNIYSLLFLLGDTSVKATGYINLIFSPIRIIVTVLAAYFFVNLIKSYYHSEYINVTLNLVFYSITLHSCVMILQFFDLQFRDFIYSYTAQGEFRSSFEYNFRMGGLSGSSGGSILSVVQSIGIIITPFIYRLQTNKLEKILLLFCTLIIFFSILICGRSGIWSSFFFTLISYLLLNSKLFLGNILKIIFVVLFLFLLLFGLSNYAVGDASENGDLVYSLRRTLDTFINFKETSKLEDETTTSLLSHYILPDSFIGLFFGDPIHITNNDFTRSLNSDIGFVRNIWSYGFIGFLVYLLPFIYFYFMSIKLKKNNLSSKLLFVISSVMFIFHFKESFMYARMLFSIYSVVLSLFLLDNSIKSRVSLTN